MGSWMINCKKYSELVSKALDEPLTFWDKISVKMHSLICPACHHVKKQLEALRQACRLIPNEDSAEQENRDILSDEACARIKEVLKNMPGKSGP